MSDVTRLAELLRQQNPGLSEIEAFVIAGRQVLGTLEGNTTALPEVVGGKGFAVFAKAETPKASAPKPLTRGDLSTLIMQLADRYAKLHPGMTRERAVYEIWQECGLLREAYRDAPVLLSRPTGTA